MTENKKHSPTPWRVENMALSTGDTIISGSNDGFIYVARAQAMNVYSERQIEQRMADAAHIVKCVNAHDEAMAILSEMADAITGDEAFDDPEEALLCWCERAAALLKKAGAL